MLIHFKDFVSETRLDVRVGDGSGFFSLVITSII